MSYLNIVLAGGGMIGALDRCLLAQKLFKVRGVFEPSHYGHYGRSTNLAIFHRGFSTLIFKNSDQERAIPMKARMIHNYNGMSNHISYNSIGRYELHRTSISQLFYQKNQVKNHIKAFHLTSTRNMFIQVEDTPNPNSLKFYPGEPVLESGTADFQDKVQASIKSPLAKALFRIKGVRSVFFAQDFITVSKEDDEKVEWNVLKPQIFSEIMIFYTMKQPILYSSLGEDQNQIDENDSEIVKQIKELIKNKIRPTIQEDGGDLEFVSYQHNIVRVRLQGACTSCPSSVVTLKNGIKNMLQYYIEEVEDVEQVIES